MPPKTRGTKVSKTFKENFNETTKSKPDIQNKTSKQPRKAFADKTNSPSDDPATIQTSLKCVTKNVKKTEDIQQFSSQRSRRVRRLPNRYEESAVLKKLSNSNLLSPEKNATISKVKITPVKKSVVCSPPAKSLKVTPIKNSVVSLPTKSHLKVKDSPLINDRPKRIQKLLNKSIDRSLSPMKPVHASTPIATLSHVRNKNVNKPIKQTKVLPKQTRGNKKVHFDDAKTRRSLKNISDTNNNGCRHVNNDTLSDSKNDSVIKSNKNNKQPIKILHPKVLKRQSNNISLRVLEDKKPIKRDASKLDVYEFTFDPNEEPQPAKKKKKKLTKKNPSQTRKVTIKSTYDKNLTKALAALKKTVKSQSTNSEVTTQKVIPQQNSINKNVNENNIPVAVDPLGNSSNDKQYSMRVEDIALQFQEDDHPINYSPVNSPDARDSPPPYVNHKKSPVQTAHKDPLNLLNDLSFFDEQPVASSSMNCSTRHPLASPWRVEFGNLPIKWHVNAHVKPNMTPAVDTSFIEFGENKKKHIYTDMVPETTETLPQLVQNTPNLKQTSIISFIKEVIDKKSNKKKKNKIVSNNPIFEESAHTLAPSHITPQKYNSLNSLTSPIKNAIPKNVENNGNLISDKLINPIQNKETHTNSVLKVAKKKKDKDITYFGFDETEDQENVSPVKGNKVRSLRPRSRAVLKEINAVKNPDKAIILSAAISKPPSSDADSFFNNIKAGTEPPVFTEVYVDGRKPDNTVNEATVTDKEVALTEVEWEDSQSVHLFEDVELVHHSKAVRKSYGKGKKVTFRHNSINVSDSDNEDDKSSDEDNLDDLSFKIPSVKEKKIRKKKKPKKQMSKKEENEAEAWAAGFNSMCDDIEEYDLVVE